jgi:cytochrome P450
MACPLEPTYPRPAPYKKHFVFRLLKGLHSWLGLLSDVDFRIPIGSVQFLGLNLFLVNEPTSVKRLMVEEVEEFPKHPFTLWILEPLIGRAIFSVNGSEWSRQRQLLDQAFQVAQLRRVLPQMQGAVEAMVNRLDQALERAEASGQPALDVGIEIDQEMTLVTADVIVRTILSRPLQAAEAAGIFEAFARYQRRAGRALMLRLLRLPQQRLQSYLGRHARTIRNWIDAAIEERLKGTAAAESDLLQALIEARDPVDGSGFTREELLDQICFLFLAGHETSASALGMAAYLLAWCPDAQQRLREELNSVAGERQGALSFDDLRQLPYAAAVFNETLRLYPPVSFFIRESQQTTDLVDRRCPMRSLVTISPWVVHRQEGQWPAPHAFQPERFLADAATPEERQLARDAWLPYGLGPRKCPGAAFALQEALLVLAELVRRYELLPEPGHTPELVARLTLRSDNGIPLRLRRLSKLGAKNGQPEPGRTMEV